MVKRQLADPANYQEMSVAALKAERDLLDSEVVVYKFFFVDNYPKQVKACDEKAIKKPKHFLERVDEANRIISEAKRRIKLIDDIIADKTLHATKS